MPFGVRGSSDFVENVLPHKTKRILAMLSKKSGATLVWQGVEGVQPKSGAKRVFVIPQNVGRFAKDFKSDGLRMFF